MLNTCRSIATTLRRRLVLEPLEDRTVPAAVTVTNLNDLVNGTTTNIAALIANDGGDGISLREAILAANDPAEDDSLTFQTGLNGTLTLTGGQMAISDAVTITGNGAASTIIDANQLSRIFEVSNTAGNVTLHSLTLFKGRTTAGGDRGGAIRFESSGTLAIRNSTLSGNSTAGDDADGGAIWATSGAVTVSNSTLSGNSTGGTGSSGGAITAATGAVTVSNSTLSGNFTEGTSSRGGAIAAANGVVTVSNSTVAFNEARNSGVGGIYTRSPIIVNNSIVARNTAIGQQAPDLYSGALDVTVRNSLIGTNAGTLLNPAPLPTPDANGNFIGTNADLIDPLLGPLGFNGGPTQTHTLQADSPALNRGLAPGAPAADQRGFGRSGAADMGAFEFGGIDPNPPPPLPPPPAPPGPSLPAVTIQVKKAKRVTRVMVLMDGAVHKTIYPFGKKFTGKVKVLQGDFNGDGLLDVRATATVNGKKKTRTFLTT